MHTVSGIILHLMQLNYNVFHQQVQSAINEGRLILPEMQIDKAPFPVHTINPNNAKVLIRPEQAEEAKRKNVIIGDSRPMNVNDKILAREVVKEKTSDGEQTLKITIRAPRLGWGAQGGSLSGSQSIAQSASPMTDPGLSRRSVRKWILGRLMR